MISNNEININTNSSTKVLNSFAHMNKSLNEFKAQITLVQCELKALEKQYKKQLVTFQKEHKNRKQKMPSGFAQPSKVTDKLCVFMNKPEGTDIARTEVTKALVQYIKQNKLQHEELDAKNKIKPDSILTELLGLEKDDADNLTFFNIQKYMNQHFISKSANNETQNQQQLCGCN